MSNILNYLFFLFVSLPASIYFNLSYLPFRQACKLPILLHKPRLLKMKGSIVIRASDVRFGMIRLGFNVVSLYRDDGISWENHGGVVLFDGYCNIGNSSAISVGTGGKLIFGSDFTATSMFKCVCYHSVVFQKNVCFAWECIVTDTDFHRLSLLNNSYKKGYAPILVGDNNWFGMRCVLLKGTETPCFFVAGANSILNRKYTKSHCVYAGNPAELKVEGVFRNFLDDEINYAN